MSCGLRHKTEVPCRWRANPSARKRSLSAKGSIFAEGLKYRLA